MDCLPFLALIAIVWISGILIFDEDSVYDCEEPEDDYDLE